ncbi:hypothetical protein [Coraliomargarita sinensis]|uniref:hypothetical protein n=1 Tax=Coraliomargarita sinensis TaxID=2174842 RepID=UPI00130482D7|nr:hypothetical protein [Coraliomargarita sinensis]
MPNNDAIRITFGTIGTASSFVLANAETAAAIFAGVATGIYMLTSTWIKIRKPKK